MFTHRLNIFASALTLLGMPVIFDCLLLSQSAVGATFNFNVSVNGKTIGNIGLNEAAGIGGKGLEGSFTPTGRTIPELMTYLAQGDPNNTPPKHLNWLQVVTKSIYPSSASVCTCTFTK